MLREAMYTFILCCMLCFLPVLSFVLSPLTRRVLRTSPGTPAAAGGLALSMGGVSNGRVRNDHLTSIQATSFRSQPTRVATRQERASYGCLRGDKQERGLGARVTKQRGWNPRSNSLRGEQLNSRQDEFVSGETLSREEFEAWSAAAAAAAAANPTSDGHRTCSATGASDATTSVCVEEVYSSRASPAGINWISILLSVVDQVLFLGFFAWLATPAIREQLRSSFVLTFPGIGLGVAGAVPMFVYGLYLGTQNWPWLKRHEQEAAADSKELNLFGRRRQQVARVAVVSVPLAMLVALCEECVYRGLVPLLLVAKTGLPVAAVVAISAVFCGARHAGTLGSATDAAVLGVYVHCLLLSTRSILVPVVAHAVFDAILFVVGHLKETARIQ
ncbi:unnamed protein product [Ectocarpus sp. 12 AP-2014]